MLKYVSYLIRSGLGVPDYWHPHLEIQDDFAQGLIARYPISMDTKGDFPGALSEDGIPLISHGQNLVTTPVVVALYGLGSYDLFLKTRAKRYREQLDAVLRWLEQHHVPLGNGIGWPHEIDMENLRAPWFSCVTQGLVMSLFVRAYQLDPTDRWRYLACQTHLGFCVPVAQGGFCREVKNGLIYEEYPTSEFNCVFNGMCCALIGLWEASRAGLVPEAAHEFRQGVNGLRSLLPMFDYDGWSLYSLSQCLGKPFLASPYYVRTNGLLAQVIGSLADEPEFTTYGRRWIHTGKSVLRRIKMSLRIALDRAPFGLFTPQVRLDS